MKQVGSTQLTKKVDGKSSYNQKLFYEVTNNLGVSGSVQQTQKGGLKKNRLMCG
jgi:hypothetical protein